MDATTDHEYMEEGDDEDIQLEDENSMETGWELGKEEIEDMEFGEQGFNEDLVEGEYHDEDGRLLQNYDIENEDYDDEDHDGVDPRDVGLEGYDKGDDEEEGEDQEQEDFDVTQLSEEDMV